MPDEQREWRLHGQFHRLDDPAIEDSSSARQWWVNDQCQHTDGPAVEMAARSEWWVNGVRHRRNGPAVKYYDGRPNEWWRDDAYYADEASWSSGPAEYPGAIVEVVGQSALGN